MTVDRLTALLDVLLERGRARTQPGQPQHALAQPLEAEQEQEHADHHAQRLERHA